MTTMTHAARVDATQVVIDRFRARAFDWSTGGTCLHLARAQMRALGHRPPAIPRFYSAFGARRALVRAGFADLAALLDSLLPRITPAEMWIGDLALMESGDDFDAVVISAGRLVAGYHDDATGVVNIEPGPIKAAWRL